MFSTRSLVVSYLRRRALGSGRSASLWRRLGRPSFADWGEYLRRHGGFRAFGHDCMMSPDNVFTDPYLTVIGDRVRMAGAWVSGHDGSVNMLNTVAGTRLDAVGPVVIGNDVFVGVGAKILPNTHIGDRVIVGAGSVVSGTIPGNSVVAGSPARRIRSVDDHLDRIIARNATYPWRHLVEGRDGGYDAALEPELKRARVAHFFEAAS